MAGTAISARQFEGTAVLVRAGRCTVTSIKYINTDTAARFCQIFDAAAVADVTLGTTVPFWAMSAGANGSDDDDLGAGIAFQNGIVVASTTTPINDTGATDDTGFIWIVIE